MDLQSRSLRRAASAADHFNKIIDKGRDQSASGEEKLLSKQRLRTLTTMLEAFVLRCTVQSRQRPNSCGRLSCIGGRRRRSNNILRAILPKRIDQTVFCRFEPSPLPARATPLAWADSGLIHVCTGRFSPGQSRLYSQLRASYLQQQHDMQPCNFLKAIGRCTV